MGDFNIGRAIARTEDLQLLRGRGRYVGDIVMPREAQLYILRSPHAAARIARIDTTAAKAAPGVIAVYTGPEVEAGGLKPLFSRARRKGPGGKPNFGPPYRALAIDRVRHVGDPVVAVIAETLAEAKDAAELVEIDYESLDAVTDTAGTLAADAPVVWDEAPGNVCYVEHVGDEAKVKAAISSAKHVVKQRFIISRVSVAPMETRNAIGLYDMRDQRYTLYTGSQTPHGNRADIAEFMLGVPNGKLRLISPDVGGGFGLKGSPFPEQGLVLWAAKQLDRPVKWVGERSESFIGDHHARDNISEVTLALDADGKFLALNVETIANLGAFLSSNGPNVPFNNLGGLSGPYTTPAIHVQVTGVFSHTPPTCPYRGAGRPEASFCVERIIDITAAELKLDRVELRRRNMIPSNAMPYKTGFLFTYDSGEFETVMDKALATGDWKNAPARQETARKAGKLYGIGMSSVIEIANGPTATPLDDFAELRFDADGSAMLIIGGHSHGQGHETVFRQMANSFLNLPPEQVSVVYGDTDKVYHGRGTFGSRSMIAMGGALRVASDRIIEKGKKIAGNLLEASPADIEFAEGQFTVAGTDKSVSLKDVARASFDLGKMPREMDMGLNANAIYRPSGATFPNGCHACEVEIDPDTGVCEIKRYAVVDDVGVMINPLLVKGQIHGGIVQGIGQALCETVVFDSGGQPLTGSFMDYAMPRADDLCALDVGSHEVPSKNNILGVKGAGEAGCVGALPAVVNAINDALRPLGIRNFDMPATPDRLWHAIRAAKNGAA